MKKGDSQHASIGRGKWANGLFADARTHTLERWWAAAFLLVASGLFAAVAAVLLRQGNSKVVWTGLLAGAILLVLERLESTYVGACTQARETKPLFLVSVILIVLVPFVLYLPTRNVYFLGDDFAHIHIFRETSLAHVLRLFYTDFSQDTWGFSFQEMRPLIGLSYMLNYFISGIHPLGYHLISILQHVLSSLIVYRIAKSMAGGEPWRAVFAGLLFAVLPAQAEAVSWISGSKADGLPTLFYLAAFLCFVRFRSTGLARYLMMSTTMFVGSLLTKEIGVTLPLMLIFYDLFRNSTAQGEHPIRESQYKNKRFLSFLMVHAPFVVALLAYLGLRRIAFQSFIKVEPWGGSLWSAFWGLQDFNLRHLALPFRAILEQRPFDSRETLSAVGLGVALGVCVAWTVSLLRGRSVHGMSIPAILYFGVVWYLISNAPLLLTYPSARHLYLPAAGPCIAMGFLVMPAAELPQRNARYLRLLTAAFLLVLSASLLWRQNADWVTAGDISRRVRADFEVALETAPRGTLVIASPPPYLGVYVWMWALPFALQEPFSSTDLYSRARVIETPISYCCPLPLWWKKTKEALVSTLQGNPEEVITVHLLTWDDSVHAMRQRKLTVPRASLRGQVAKALKRPVEDVESVDSDTARMLVESLTEFVAAGGRSEAGSVAKPEIYAAGSGCSDRFCIWITGKNFAPDAYVEVGANEPSGDVMAAYSGGELARSFSGDEQRITLRLSEIASQRTLFAVQGLRIWVVNPTARTRSEGVAVKR